MKTAERIYKEALTLPETQAKEVLDFVEFLKGKHNKTTAFETENTSNCDVLPGFGMWAGREKMSRRDVFTELSSALVEAKAHSEGKLTLKTHQAD